MSYATSAEGHWSAQLHAAKTISGYSTEFLPPRFFAKGSYCSLSGMAPLSHLIYPVPVSGALGIHATLGTTNTVRFGPDIQWVDTIDYSLPEGLAENFRKRWSPIGQVYMEAN
jgi:L-2-hydroxyglutarate oxidase LhgO